MIFGEIDGLSFAVEYVDQGRAQGEAKGRAEGEVKALLAVVEARGIEASEHVRARIAECADPDVLEAWVRRAAVIDSIDELFD